MTNFVYMRKNFTDAQKLSGRQCRYANEVFGTLIGKTYMRKTSSVADMAIWAKNKLQKLEDALIKQMLTADDLADRGDWGELGELSELD